MAAKLQATFTSWLKTNHVTGGEIAIDRNGPVWQSAIGTANGATNAATTTPDIWSVTKTFTAALVWQAVDKGQINIDAPIPALSAVASFPYAGKITYRQLLAHRSGLADYHNTPAYTKDPNSIDSPAKALADVATQPLHFTPGTKTEYTSTNYLVLGALLEQVTGKTYDSLLTDLEHSAGLGDITHDAPWPGHPDFSTAGLRPTMAQLAAWGTALLGQNKAGLAAADLTAMMALDPDSSVGQGLWGYCPCTIDAKGAHHWTALGHGGASTQLEYAPADHLSIAVNIDDSIYAPDNRQDNLNKLFIDLRAIVDAA